MGNLGKHDEGVEKFLLKNNFVEVQCMSCELLKFKSYYHYHLDNRKHKKGSEKLINQIKFTLTPYPEMNDFVLASFAFWRFCTSKQLLYCNIPFLNSQFINLLTTAITINILSCSTSLTWIIFDWDMDSFVISGAPVGIKIIT